MSSEGPQEPAEANQPPVPAASQPVKKKKKKAKPPAPPPPLTEEQIDSPNNQTLGMLGVIGVMTLVMWIFARGGCNYHPPKETRDPRKIDLVELAREPKDAALEFELRWATKSFGGALELAKGPMLDVVKKEQQACDADASCAARASDLRSTVAVTAELLERDATRSVSRVTTVGASAKPSKHIIRVERDGVIWKTVSREVDDGTFVPRPPHLVGRERDGALLFRQPGMPGTTPDGAPAGSESREHK
jgi:hypothetical protein